jgi:hypothetical protein
MTSYIPEQLRIAQLVSSYGPHEPPQLPLTFGDYLSLLWRLDRAMGHDGRVMYYKHCINALSEALGFGNTELGMMLRITTPGDFYANLSHMPYRKTERPVDAPERRSAIGQLLMLRSDILSIGSYNEGWAMRFPGSGIIDTELRDRVYQVLFTALPSQYPVFARLLLVIDIVLQELLVGKRKSPEIDLSVLVEEYNYPNPNNPDVHTLYAQEAL